MSKKLFPDRSPLKAVQIFVPGGTNIRYWRSVAWVYDNKFVQAPGKSLPGVRPALSVRARPAELADMAVRAPSRCEFMAQMSGCRDF
jgi:hypothetical protein